MFAEARARTIRDALRCGRTGSGVGDVKTLWGLPL
jgi:hypothetical protein